MRIKNSPWGEVDQETQHAEGVYFVSTPGHGGFMVHKSVSLSEAAKDQADTFGEFYCFEEDCLAYIVLHELQITNARTSLQDIKKALCFWLPEYVEKSGNKDWFIEFPKRN